MRLVHTASKVIQAKIQQPQPGQKLSQRRTLNRSRGALRIKTIQLLHRVQNTHGGGLDEEPLRQGADELGSVEMHPGRALQVLEKGVFLAQLGTRCRFGDRLDRSGNNYSRERPSLMTSDAASGQV